MNHIERFTPHPDLHQGGPPEQLAHVEKPDARLQPPVFHDIGGGLPAAVEIRSKENIIPVNIVACSGGNHVFVPCHGIIAKDSVGSTL